MITGNSNKLRIFEVYEENYKEKRGIDVYSKFKTNIKDFLTFNRGIIVLTINNHILVFNKYSKILQRRFLGVGEGETLAICGRNRYLFVSERHSTENFCTGIRVFKVDKKLKFLTFFDTKEMGFGPLTPFSVYGYLGNSVIISAIPRQNDHPLLTFKYDIRENKLVEVSELRKVIKHESVDKLCQRKDGSIFGISSYRSKLLSFNYKRLN